MPITTECMGDDKVSVPLVPETPKSIIDSIAVPTRGFSSIVVTPSHWPVGTLSDANLLDQARGSFVYLGQSDDRLTLEGAGLGWWLGDNGDNGALVITDGTFGNVTISSFITNNVCSNGITAGTINASATTRQLKYEAGTSRLQLLETACAAYADPNYEYRINPDGTLDVNTGANLFSIFTTVLTQEGGRDGNINGVRAEIELDTIDVEDFRTKVEVDWNAGVNNGSASNSVPSTWVDFAGSTPNLITLIDSAPKVPFRQRPRKSLRINAINYAAWALNSQTQANTLATRHATQSASYAVDLTANIDEYDPWRFVNPGDVVYVYDLDLGLYDTTQEVYYRGQAIHPTYFRVQAMTTPIQEGYGVYLRYWNGASFSYLDLTPYVDWEEGDTTLELGRTARLRPGRARPKRINRRRLRREYRRTYRIQQYVAAVGR